MFKARTVLLMHARLRSVYVLILQAKEQGKAEMEELLTKLQKVI